MSRAIFLPRGRNRSRRKKFDCCISRVSYSRLAQLLASDRARSFFPLSVFITPPSPPPSTPLFSPHPKLVPRTVINRGKTTESRYTYTLSALNSFACLSNARDCIRSCISRLVGSRIRALHLRRPNGHNAFSSFLDRSFPSPPGSILLSLVDRL